MDPYILFISLFGPFFVWPVEYFLPYPYIVEELFKTALVFFFPKNKIGAFLCAGIAFATTETVLYSLNANAFGQVSLIFVRLITSGLLHTTTFLIIFFSAKKNRRLLPAGFLAAALIHYLFNVLITQ